MDAHKNFAYSNVVTAPSPATSGTTLSVTAGTGTLFPAVPFNCTVWPASVQPLSTNAEIVRVTAISGDTFTITRAQENSTAMSILVGYQIAATITAKTLTDVENISVLAGNLTVPGHAAIGSDSVINLDANTILYVYEQMGARTGFGNVAFLAFNEAVAGVTAADQVYGFYGGASTHLTGAAISAQGVTGLYSQSWNAGTGTVSVLTGLFLDIANNGGGIVPEAYGSYLNYANTGTTGAYYGHRVTSVTGAGTITSIYSFFGNNQDKGTNNYFLWYDGTGTGAGVWRVNGLGIVAYYNPAFTTYTPGATNYERIVTQWNSSVAEIGTEAGGTGTIRALRIVGAATVTGSSFVTSTGTYMMQSSAAWSNGAGGSGGTLTNAPAAGNPTKWIPVNDNGTTRYIPAW